jgi:hypothetical protein
MGQVDMGKVSGDVVDQGRIGEEKSRGRVIGFTDSMDIMPGLGKTVGGATRGVSKVCYGGAVGETGGLGGPWLLVVSQFLLLVRNMLRGGHCHGEERGYKITGQDVFLHGERMKMRMLA